MAIEAILEKEWKTTWLEIRTGIKVKLVLHCSCGHDFKAKEKFPVRYIGGEPETYLRPVVCPSCNKKDYLAHHVHRPEEDLYRYGVEIVEKG